MAQDSQVWGIQRATLLGAAFLAGCASLPERTPAAALRDPAALASGKALASAEAPWPSQDWWLAYADPQLNALIAEGLKGSPSLAAASARLRAAFAVEAGARADAGPAASVNASVKAAEQSENAGIPPAFIPSGYQDFGRATLNFSYELDFWGRNRARIAAATSDVKAATAEAAQARLALSTAIAAAYADLVRLQAQRDIAAKSLDVRTQTVALVQRRVSIGLDNEGALRQAEAGPHVARAEIAALDESLAQTRNRLAALVGAGPERGGAIEAPASVHLQPFGLPKDLAVDLIGRRPDLVAARWRAEAAGARTDEARAAFYPDVNLSAFVGAEALGLDNLARGGSRIGSIGPALSLPVFFERRLSATLTRADAERDAAIAAYNSTLVEALNQVADVASSERALDLRLGETRAALAADESAYAIARRRYEGGLSTYQNVLIAEDAVLAQRRAVADLESRAFVLDVALVRALGGGFVAGRSERD